MKLSKQFVDALAYAANLHADQVRKGDGNIPYISHLLGVTSIVLEYGGNEEQAIAALLHDAVEDQGGMPQLENIRQQFGEAVAQIVADCTDSFETPKAPWRQRKEAYIEHLARISSASRLVSCADKLYNARSILKDYRQQGEALWGRFKGGRQGTLWYYHTLVAAFKAIETHPLIDELNRVVIELELLAAAGENQ